jgi:hypothetical protein
VRGPGVAWSRGCFPWEFGTLGTVVRRSGQAVRDPAPSGIQSDTSLPYAGLCVCSGGLQPACVRSMHGRRHVRIGFASPAPFGLPRHTHTHIPQTNGTTALVYAKRDLDRQDRPTTRSRRLSQLPSTAGREQDHTRTSSIACTHACPDACACSGTGHRWALAMQSLKRRPCMPCDKGRNGACMHGDGRRQHHAARRSESPASVCIRQVGRGDKRGRQQKRGTYHWRARNIRTARRRC